MSLAQLYRLRLTPVLQRHPVRHPQPQGSILRAAYTTTRSINPSFRCSNILPKLNKAGKNNRLVSCRQWYNTTSTPSSSIVITLVSATHDPRHLLAWFQSWWNKYYPAVSIDTRNEDSSNTVWCTSSRWQDDNATKNIRRRWYHKVWHKIRQWIQTLQKAWFISVRSTEIALRCAPLLLLTPTSMILPSPRLTDWTWNYVYHMTTALGPAFLKLAQWISTRHDIFPPHLCLRLGKLQDRGLPHQWRDTHQMLQHAFGDDYHEHLHIPNQNDSLIGVGSAAQVYQGILTVPTTTTTTTTKTNATTSQQQQQQQIPVAIKVLHPQLKRRLQRDLYLMEVVAEFAHKYIPSEQVRLLHLPRVAQNFETILLDQTDMRTEADNLHAFRTNFYDHNKDSAILFPKPMDDWTCETVLVEELVCNASPISKFLLDNSEEGMQLRKELASPLLRAFLKMIFLDNFVHCDLHQGNILVVEQPITDGQHPKRRNSAVSLVEGGLLWLTGQRQRTTTKSNSKKADVQDPEVHRQIVFLDAGLATSLSPQDQRNLRDLFRAVILNDGNTAGRLMVERAKYAPRCRNVPGDVDEFAAGVEALVSEFHDNRRKGLTLGAVRIGSLLSRVLELCRVYGVEIDPSMASIVISTLVLEGLGRSLEPNLNLIDFALPFVLGRGRV